MSAVPASELIQIRDPLLLAYEERQRRLKRDPKTTMMFRQTARKFQAFLDDIGKGAADVESWELEEWILGLDLAVTTKHAHLKRLSWAYNYAVRRKVAPGNITLDVRLPSQPDSEPVIVPNVELREMRARIAGDRQWAQFHLLAYAGLRRHEVIGLDWACVDLERATLTIHGKQGKLRKVPIHPALGEALVSVRCQAGLVIPGRGGRQVGGDTWDALLASYAQGEYTAHDFRRTVATSLDMNGVRESVIDQIMGWAPRAIRNRYYRRFATTEMQQAILRLYADDPV